MEIEPVKVMVVDDSAMFRLFLRTMLEDDPRFLMVGAARNGQEALDGVARHQPEVIILDVEMPIMNGLEALKRIKARNPEVEAIMFSAYTKNGAQVTVEALEIGAFDFVPKPDADSIEDGQRQVRHDLVTKLTYLHTRKTLRQVSQNAKTAWEKHEPKPSIPLPEPIRPLPVVQPVPRHRDVVAVGISTGGPRALAQLLAGLPADLSAAVLIVQHMPPMFTQTLAQRLNEISGLEIKEAETGNELRPGVVFLAPGGRHMTVQGRQHSMEPFRIHINDDPPENGCRPSADVLFRSVAECCGSTAVGVIMTGMGTDGTRGLRSMRERGAYLIAQNEATCAVYGMPKRPVEEGLIREVLPLEDMADAINRLTLPRY